MSYPEIDEHMPIGQLVMEIRGCRALLQDNIEKELFNDFFRCQIERGKKLILLSGQHLSKENKYSIDIHRWQNDLATNLKGFSSMLDNCSCLLRSSLKCYSFFM